MKKCLLVLITLTVCVFSTSCATDDRKGKTFQKNIGVSHGTVNVSDEAQSSQEDPVPSKEDIIANLDEKGFTITEDVAVPGSDIPVDRVYAENGELFFDICYGLTEEQADEIFGVYESTYDENEIYLLADNQDVIYAVSDSNTFKAAGFETLATNGRLYIWE